jgi:hypothetical protein
MMSLRPDGGMMNLFHNGLLVFFDHSVSPILQELIANILVDAFQRGAAPFAPHTFQGCDQRGHRQSSILIDITSVSIFYPPLYKSFPALPNPAPKFPLPPIAMMTRLRSRGNFKGNRTPLSL